MKLTTLSYLILSIASIAVLAAAYRKFPSKKLFSFFFSVSGITLFFDYVIYVWGKAYLYKPDMISGKFDTHLGALANALVLPAVAALFSAANGGWIASILLALLFTATEILFTKIDAYESYWWNPLYTFIILIFYFPVTKGWWHRLHPPRGTWVLTATMTGIVFGVRIPLAIMMYGVWATRAYHIPWLEKLHVNGSALNTWIVVPLGIAYSCIVLFGFRRRWLLCVAAVSSGIDLILKGFGYIQAHSAWDFALYALADLMAMLVVLYLGFTYKEDRG